MSRLIEPNNYNNEMNFEINKKIKNEEIVEDNGDLNELATLINEEKGTRASRSPKQKKRKTRILQFNYRSGIGKTLPNIVNYKIKNKNESIILDSDSSISDSESTISIRDSRIGRNEYEKLYNNMYKKYKNIVMMNQKLSKGEFSERLNGVAWPTKKIRYKSIGKFTEGGQAQIHLFLKRKEIKINDKKFYGYINNNGNFVFLRGYQYDKLNQLFDDYPWMKKVICNNKNGQKLPRFGYFRINFKNKKIERMSRNEFNVERMRDHILEEKLYVGKIFKEKKFYHKERKIYEKLKKCYEDEENIYTINLKDIDDKSNALYFDYLENYENMKEYRIRMISNMHERQRKLNDEYLDLSYSFDDFDTNQLKYFDVRETLLSFNNWLKIVKNLLKSVEFIHRNNIYHRDLSPGNIMINKNTNKVLLIDFGFSWTPDNKSSPKETTGYKKTLEPHLEDIDDLEDNKLFTKKFNNYAVSQVGTLRFIAPEVLIKDKKYDPEKADMWSLGCILYSLLFGTYPYSTPFKRDKNYVSYYSNNAEENVNRCYYNKEKFNNDQIKLISFLINNCKKINPKNRRSVKELINAIDLYEDYIEQNRINYA